MTKRPFFRPLALLALLAAAACATTAGAGSGRSPSVLLADEIQSLNVDNAYQAVERSRPQWLNARASPTPANPGGAEPVVYVDGIRAGDLLELRRVRVASIVRMEFLRASDATSRYGTNHGGGAILVTTR